MRTERRKVAPSVRKAASVAVCARLLARDDVRAARRAKQPFAVYLATPDEIDLSPLIDRLWAESCPVYVPAWRNGTYALVPYSKNTRLVVGKMGVLEPDPEGSVPKDSGSVPTDSGSVPKVWIVPGLAFTHEGERLGYGGGWYDRFLSAAGPTAVALGVAYPFQMVDALPSEAHDRRLTAVVVAEGTFAFPRVLAWEVTRRCPMKCRHCRAAADDCAYEGELSTAECRQVIDSLAAHAPPPMIIWTGGEPMSRADLPALVRYATEKGLRSVLAPCGLFATRERLLELKAAGVMACSFSLDGPDRISHDAFRGVEGAWDAVKAAMAAARAVGLPFQVNTVVRKGALDRLDGIYAQALAEGATRLDLFFLVPTGRGRLIDGLVPDAAETEAVIAWAAGKRTKLTCCPQAGTCIGGRGFAFLSHTGTLQTCGFVPTPCGDIRDFGFDFARLVAAAVNPLGVAGNCRGR